MDRLRPDDEPGHVGRSGWRAHRARSTTRAAGSRKRDPAARVCVTAAPDDFVDRVRLRRPRPSRARDAPRDECGGKHHEVAHIRTTATTSPAIFVRRPGRRLISRRSIARRSSPIPRSLRTRRRATYDQAHQRLSRDRTRSASRSPSRTTRTGTSRHRSKRARLLRDEVVRPARSADQARRAARARHARHGQPEGDFQVLLRSGREPGQGGEPARLGRLTRSGAEQGNVPEVLHDLRVRRCRPAGPASLLPTDPGAPNSEAALRPPLLRRQRQASSGRRCPSRRRLRATVKDEDKTRPHLLRHRTGCARPSTPVSAEIHVRLPRPRGWQAERTPSGKPTERVDVLRRTRSCKVAHRLRDEDGDVHVRRRTTTVTRVDDQSGGERHREADRRRRHRTTASIARTKVVQKKQGQSFWLFTTMSYDLNGNVLMREDDGRQDPVTGNVTRQPRKNELSYDQADWVTQQLDRGRDTGLRRRPAYHDGLLQDGLVAPQEGGAGHRALRLET